MKILKTLLLVFFTTTRALAQTVQISGSNPPPVLFPGENQAIGYFNISSDETVLIEKCRMSFTDGFERIDKIYSILEEIPDSIWQGNSLTNPIIHQTDYLLNLEGEENVSLKYLADINETQTSSLELSYTLCCKISSYGDSSQWIWTDTINVSMPFYSSTFINKNNNDFRRIIVRRNSVFIPKNTGVLIYSISGQKADSFKQRKIDREEKIILSTGIYLLYANKEFVRRIQIFN